MIRLDQNILVHQSTRHAEFFQIALHHDDSWSLSKYMVPGRLDIYFVQNRDRFVWYSTGSNTSLLNGVSAIAQDLDRPEVVTLIRDFCREHRRLRLFGRFIGNIAPKSKVAKAIGRQIRLLDALAAGKKGE